MSSNFPVLQPSGVLDGPRAGQLRQEINEYLDSNSRVILVDLKAVTFIDSSGLGALVAALKSARSNNGKLYLCSVNDQVKMLFELTGMDRVFEIFPNQEEFQKAGII